MQTVERCGPNTVPSAAPKKKKRPTYHLEQETLAKSTHFLSPHCNAGLGSQEDQQLPWVVGVWTDGC